MIPLGGVRTSDTDVMWGVGLRFNIGPVFVRGEFEVFELGDFGEVSLTSVGLAFRF